MRQWRCGGRFHVGALGLAVAAAASCASSRGSSVAQDDTLAAADTSRKTQQQVQSELMAFADRYFAATLEAAKILELELQTSEGRYTAAAARLVGLMVTTDIAASPNPGAALLDMTVFVTLRRMVWQDYWMPEVYGDAGAPVLEILLELEDDIRGIAAGVYTPDQLAELGDLIDDWRAQHPNAVAVDFMRLTEIGDARQVQTLIDAGRPGGMLAPMKEANRNVEEMRLLAERLAFLATRMQLMLSLQVEMASAKLAVQPEVRQLIEDSRTFAEASDRAAEAFAALVADLPEHRRAAIDQILSGLGDEREKLLDDLAAEDGDLRPALGDFRDTFEAGRRLAEMLNEAVVNTDLLVKRVLEDETTRPFDILEYQATLAEATLTAREIQQVIARVEHLLVSEDLEHELGQVVDSAKRLEDEVVDDVIDRVFLRGVALIVIFFIALTIYRRLVRRLAPDLAPKRKNQG
jgi:hypothetical protein